MRAASGPTGSGWTRLLSGRVLDSRIGRDVLIGLSFAAARLLLDLCRLLPLASGGAGNGAAVRERIVPVDGPLLLLARWVVAFSSALQISLMVAMVFVVLRLVLKRSWLAIAAGIVVLVVVTDNGSAVSGSWIDTTSAILSTALSTFAVYRYGLLVVTVALFVGNILQNVPLTLNASAWWATPSNLTLALFVGLACFGYYAARAGQPLLWPAPKDAR